MLKSYWLRMDNLYTKQLWLTLIPVMISSLYFLIISSEWHNHFVTGIKFALLSKTHCVYIKNGYSQ